MVGAKAAKQKFTFFLKQSSNAWQFWAILIILFSGGAGFVATNALLRLPKTPQCARIFWPVASASLRFYCAELEAEKGTVEGLLTGIELIEALPADHPLRHQVNENAEEWAEQILVLAEENFQTGKIEEAIETVQQIPEKSQAYALVEEKIAEWRETWQNAETIYGEIEEELREWNWNLAFRYAVKLLAIDNKYWATTKYDETINNIQLARSESRQLDDAFDVLKRGGIDNWLKAVEVADKVSSESYTYRKAQEVISEAKTKITDYVEELVTKRDWNTLANVTNRLPNSLNLEDQQLLTWRTFASAGLDADLGSVQGLEAAIATISEIEADHPRYAQAQTLMNRWTVEIEDVTNLAQARDIARGGGLENLKNAISQANLVGSGNPRYKEARTEIQDWNRQIQIIEDQPILDQARALATGGDLNDLRSAIAQANLIGSNRVLHQEARGEIRRWREKIQRQEDQPILDQAIALGNIKDYQAAISTAQRIGRGRVLYSKAQSHTQGWRKEIQAQQQLQRAYAMARSKSPEALLNAMEIAQRVPENTDMSGQRLAALNRWSYQVLNVAQQRADSGQLGMAIALAKRIPRESGAYNAARTQIQRWQQMLTPPPVALPPSQPTQPLQPMQPFPPLAPDPVPAAPETVETNFTDLESTNMDNLDENQ
ncbi:MAG: chromosome segregation ATPase [Microcystaceae cyanobacterium]